MRPSALLLLLLPGLATAGELRRLHAEQATASSFLRSNWNRYEENYHPSYVLDDDPKTAWVEGADGDGVGERLTVPLSNLASARTVRLVIFNGFQKSPALLTANAAPRKLTVQVLGPGGRESARVPLELARRMGPQSFDIPLQAGGGVAEVVLTIDSVHPGSKYRDTCISDVQVLVDSDVPYEPAVEQGKRAAMLRWKQERLEVAKYYAALPPQYPYASTRFERRAEPSKRLARRYARVVDTDKDGYPDEGVPAEGFVPLRTQLESGVIRAPLPEADRALLVQVGALAKAPPPADARWYSVSMRGRTVPPEGFPLPRAMEPLFHLGDATLFEAAGPGRTTPVLADSLGYEEGEVLSNLRLLEGTPTDPRRVYFRHTRMVSERTLTTWTTHGIAMLEGGRLVRLAILEETKDEAEGEATGAAVHAVTHTGGKVSRVEVTRLVDQDSTIDGPDPEAGIFLERATLEVLPRS